MRGHFIRTFLV